MCSACFPRLSLPDDASLPLHRVLRGEFPCFNGTIKALRLPATRLAALRCLRLAIPRWALVLFAPRRTSTTAEAWSCSPGSSSRDSTEETTGSPKLLGNPNCPFAHVLRLRQDCLHQTSKVQQHGPHIEKREGSHEHRSFEAQ